MSRPMTKIVDISTQIEEFRQMTDEEFAQYLKDQDSDAALIQVNE
jgi:hypothetical protein